MLRFPVGRSACCLVLAVLAGCVPFRRPAPPQDLPSHWRNATAAPAPLVDLQGWWKAFGDPTLDGLVEQAVAQNLTVAQAGRRLQAARILAEHGQDAYLPQLSASAHSNEQVSATDTFYQVSLDSVWELGLFGEREGKARQQQARVALAEADEQAARVAVVAELVRNYLELRAAQAQIRDLQALGELDRRALELHEVRVASHLDAADRRLQLQAQQARNQARLSAPRQIQARAEHNIAALLGRSAPDPAWSRPGELPSLVAGAPESVPSDLLRTRPDVQRAEAELLEATGELGVAKARLYPHVALGISYLFAYNVTQHENVGFNGVPMIGPMIDIPLFDWGQRQAMAKAQRELVQAALDGYRQTLVGSVAQTEAALAALNQQQSRLKFLLQAADALGERHTHQQALSDLGLASEWDLLGSRRERLEQGLQVSGAQAARDLAFVALYRALGGAPQPKDAPNAPAPAPAAGAEPRS